MAYKKSTDPPPKPSPQRKATNIAREMIDEERRLREEKTERLRKAREASEARKPRS